MKSASNALPVTSAHLPLMCRTPLVMVQVWVGPPWLQPSAPKKKFQLVMPPQDVFGCRGHPTTAMVLEFLEESRTLKGATVLDVAPPIALERPATSVAAPRGMPVCRRLRPTPVL